MFFEGFASQKSICFKNNLKKDIQILFTMILLPTTRAFLKSIGLRKGKCRNLNA
jgi:hypothetical protein